MVRPVLENVTRISIDPALPEKYYYEKPEKRIYFDRFGDGISARVELLYDTQALNPAAPNSSSLLQNNSGKILLRSINEENQLMNIFNHSKFKSRYELPIIKNSQAEAMEGLKRHIKPFILRRMKKEVLQELPEKIEHKMSCAIV